MANTFAQNMKNAILTDLQSLVTAGTFRFCFADDMTKVNPLDRTGPASRRPSSFRPPSSTSEYEDTATNLREYTWYIMVVTTPDNLPKTDPTYLEGLVDAVLNVFDLDCTLQGTAIGAVMPAVLEPPGPVTSNSVTYVCFYLTLKARALVPAAVKSA